MIIGPTVMRLHFIQFRKYMKLITTIEFFFKYYFEFSHNFLQSYWQDATTDVLLEEFSGQRELIAHFANIPAGDIQGMRVPQFQMAGNNSVEVARDIGLTYDSTWQTQEFIEPGLWPYSLDYQSTQGCEVGSCPTASVPGVWVAPLLSWTDIEGYFCTMVDTCPYM